MKRLRVKLTLAQADQVEWALGPMVDFWCTDDGAHERDGKKYFENEMPVLGPHVSSATGKIMKTSKLLELSQHDEINSDLLYRLEIQLQDMTEVEVGQKARSIAKSARNAAFRIRHRSPNLAKLPRGGGWVKS